MILPRMICRLQRHLRSRHLIQHGKAAKTRPGSSRSNSLTQRWLRSWSTLEWYRRTSRRRNRSSRPWTPSQQRTRPRSASSHAKWKLSESKKPPCGRDTILISTPWSSLPHLCKKTHRMKHLDPNSASSGSSWTMPKSSRLEGRIRCSRSF